MDKISYALGLSVGNSLLSSGVKKVDVESFTKALQDVMNAVEPSLSYDEANTIINEYFSKVQESKLEINLEEGRKFLEQNKSKAGVISLPSGLQYQVLAEGKGGKPSAVDQVKCHYHGMLIDGTVFDSSVERGTPATFGVSQVIPGWVEALQLMPVGSKWRLFIPSELGYGAQGAGQAIEPNSSLIFDVELLDII